MPQLLDMSLFSAAQMATSHPWNALKGRFEAGIQQANQSRNIDIYGATDQLMGQALSPMFSALGGLASQGVQSLLYGGGGGAALGATQGVMSTQSGQLVGGSTGLPLSGVQQFQYQAGQPVNTFI